MAHRVTYFSRSGSTLPHSVSLVCTTQDKELTFRIGVALHIHYAARLLLLLNRPSPGGFGGYLHQQRLVSKYGDNICGIAMTLTDDASSILSSLCLYIGMAC